MSSSCPSCQAQLEARVKGECWSCQTQLKANIAFNSIVGGVLMASALFLLIPLNSFFNMKVVAALPVVIFITAILLCRFYQYSNQLLTKKEVLPTIGKPNSLAAIKYSSGTILVLYCGYAMPLLKGNFSNGSILLALCLAGFAFCFLYKKSSKIIFFICLALLSFILY